MGVSMTGWVTGRMRSLPEAWNADTQNRLAREENVPTRGHPRGVSSSHSCPQSSPSQLSFTALSPPPLLSHSLGLPFTELLPPPSKSSVVPWLHVCLSISLAHTPPRPCLSQLGHLGLVI